MRTRHQKRVIAMIVAGGICIASPSALAVISILGLYDIPEALIAIFVGLFMVGFFTLCGLLVADFVLKPKERAMEAVFEQKAKTAAQKSRAEKAGRPYCSASQAKDIYNILDYHIRGAKCPVCGTAVEYEDDWEMTITTTLHEAVEGVYVAYNFSTTVEQAYQDVTKERTYPASSCRCPKCEWSLRRAEYPSYETETLKRVDKQFSHGKLLVDDSFCENADSNYGKYIKK